MLKNTMIKVFVIAAALFAGAASAEEGAGLQIPQARPGNLASVQSGARLFFNYCSGCHSLKYLRYSRIGEDLGLSEDEVMQNLNFTGGKIGDQVQVSLTEENAQQWFGKMPPDLSLIARVRGSDWVYTYLKSFYLDESRPLGWNNKLFPNASMPNPLWQMQGLQHAEYGEPDKATGERPVHGLKVTTPGTQTPEQFDQSVRDITTFLEYAGEPAVLKREKLGVWVVLFLAFFTLMAYLLKHEYWKDVH